MKCETLHEQQLKLNLSTQTECNGYSALGSKIGSKLKHKLPRVKLYFQFERIN